VGADLRQKALFAIFYAMLLIAIYISGRFELKWVTAAMMGVVMLVGVFLLEALGLNVVYLILVATLITLAFCWVLKLPYALAAVLALIHDVLITVGAFVMTDKEFTLEILAALLTIAGYSLNDTIVVFDRIRENLRKDKRQPLIETINASINQTLSRTILTGGTTLAALVFLFFFGGTVIHDFAFAMIIGIVTGTYSSIFVASPLLILYEDWTKTKRKPARATA
jgi:preprotein translocase subunit SecF